MATDSKEPARPSFASEEEEFDQAVQFFKRDDIVVATASDGLDYTAQIVYVNRNKKTFTVRYADDSKERLSAADIRPITAEDEAEDEEEDEEEESSSSTSTAPPADQLFRALAELTKRKPKRSLQAQDSDRPTKTRRGHPDSCTDPQPSVFPKQTRRHLKRCLRAIPHDEPFLQLLARAMYPCAQESINEKDCDVVKRVLQFPGLPVSSKEAAQRILTRSSVDPLELDAICDVLDISNSPEPAQAASEEEYREKAAQKVVEFLARPHEFERAEKPRWFSQDPETDICRPFSGTVCRALESALKQGSSRLFRKIDGRPVVFDLSGMRVRDLCKEEPATAPLLRINGDPLQRESSSQAWRQMLPFELRVAPMDEEQPNEATRSPSSSSDLSDTKST